MKRSIVIKMYLQLLPVFDIEENMFSSNVPPNNVFDIKNLQMLVDKKTYKYVFKFFFPFLNKKNHPELFEEANRTSKFDFQYNILYKLIKSGKENKLLIFIRSGGIYFECSTK